jgi:hypothetical protein
MIALPLNRIAVSCLAVGLALFGAATNAQGAPVVYDWNFFGASGGTVPNIVGIDDAQLLAGSILGFRDLDASGGISTGDTFQDYSMIRITGFTGPGGGNVTPLTYGTGPGRDHEITIKMAFHGHQISPNQYVVDGIDLFEVYMDFGLLFSGSDFFNLTTFENDPFVLGDHVETGDKGGPGGGNNAGPTSPNGTIDVIVRMFDLLHTFDPEGDYAELDTVTKEGLDTAGLVVLQGIFDADNKVSPPAPLLGGLNAGTFVGPGAGTLVVTGYADVYAVPFAGNDGGMAGGLAGLQNPDGTIALLADVNGPFSFGFQTNSNGSYVKAVQIIPEPSAIVLWGLFSAFGLAYSRRRKHAS